MFFLNFGWLEFAMLAGAASAMTVALYLLDRSRRRQVVPTLRFWTQAKGPVQASRRKHVQQPWSLALQLLGVLLLLSAIAQPRFGNPFAKPGYHVLILETSAWMGARTASGTLMDEARLRANHWLNAVPANDRVMLVRADALATPATAFEADRARIRAAIARSEPGATALDIEQAIGFARRAQAMLGGRGEVAFAGSGRIRDTGMRPRIDGRGLRVMLVPDAIENTGLRRVGIKRSSTDPSEWDALVSMRNYGLKPRAVTLAMGFNKSPIGVKRMVLNPGATEEAAFAWRSRRAGLLEVELTPGDNFVDDDRASLVTPAAPVLPIVVYTGRPEILQALFTANARVQAEFRPIGAYTSENAGLVVLDRFRPSTRPKGNAIWIYPPAGESPVPVAKEIENPRGLEWITNNELAAGLREHDARIASALIFQPVPGDITVARVDDGPVIVARPAAQNGEPRMVAIGFDPGVAPLRFELTTPLVFADILRWMNPEIFRQSDLSIQPAGLVSASLEGAASTDALQVTRADGSPVPYTADRGTLRFFSGDRENVRVTGQERDSTYSLTLPGMWDSKWDPPADARIGEPAPRGFEGTPPEIWPWLAIGGAVCLAIEWLLFARVRKARLRAVTPGQALRRAS